MMPIRQRTREKARTYRIARERQLNAAQRELDDSAAEVQEEARRARRRATTHEGTIDYLRESLSRPKGYEPDYGNDPPPF